MPFLLRGLGHHLRAAGLPEPVVDALGIWTHIAGQPLAGAPAPMALVPAIVHTVGAYTVRGGIRRIPEVLERVARELGVQFRLGSKVQRIVHDGAQITGVQLADQQIAADRIFSDAGIGTFTSLLDPPLVHVRRRMQRLPLQSPGVAAWLRVEAEPELPFLQFWLPTVGLTRVLVHPGAVDPSRAGQARIVNPVDHGWAEQVGRAGQDAHLDAVLAERWWRDGVRDHAVVARRVPVDWGARFHLHRDAMNPVMTAAFMRRGRVPHQGPLRGLYVVGASTHPGQWVSFCAISGVLAADLAMGGPS